MVKQYIGARYVPIFAGEYNSEMAYEPLSIVTYLNSSYTSKKTVPAGTLPTNTEYWALTGNYNAQVEEYREEVENYSLQVEHYQEEVENYSLQVEHYQEEVDRLSEGYTDIAESIKAIDIHGKSILIIGDSNSDVNVVPRNWAVQFKELVEECGGSVTISGADGAAILATGVGSISSRYNSLGGSNYDYVIIQLGVNDWLYNETLASLDSEFATFMNLVNSAQTPPELYWMMPFKTNDRRQEHTPLDFYRSFYAHVALRYGIRLIDGASAPMVSLMNNYASKYYRPDGMNIHPNELGSMYIARFAFKKFLSGGDSGIASYTTSCSVPSLVNTITTNITFTSEGIGSFSIEGNITANAGTINIMDLSTPEGDMFKYMPNGLISSIVPLTSSSGMACAFILKDGSNIKLQLSNYTAGATYEVRAKVPIYISPYMTDYGQPT